jgi:flagellar biosynthetic protein FliQ
MMSELFWTAFEVCAPVLAITLLVGVTVSVIQVVTQIQEMSLTFIPKLLAAGFSFILFGPWMLRKLTQFSIQLWSSIPSMF